MRAQFTHTGADVCTCFRYEGILSSADFRRIKTELSSRGALSYSTLNEFSFLPYTPGMMNQEMPSGRMYVLGEARGGLR